MSDTKKKHDIFLSYSRAQRKIMERLRNDLQDAAMSVWTDDGLEPGTDVWQRDIEQAIKQAHCMVVVLSPSAKESDWVGIEISLAKRFRLRIFPVLVAGNEHNAIPVVLTNTQYVDASKDYGQVANKLIPALHRHLGTKQETFPSQKTQKTEPQAPSKGQSDSKTPANEYEVTPPSLTQAEADILSPLDSKSTLRAIGSVSRALQPVEKGEVRQLLIGGVSVTISSRQRLRRGDVFYDASIRLPSFPNDRFTLRSSQYGQRDRLLRTGWTTSQESQDLLPRLGPEKPLTLSKRLTRILYKYWDVKIKVQQGATNPTTGPVNIAMSIIAANIVLGIKPEDITIKNSG